MSINKKSLKTALTGALICTAIAIGTAMADIPPQVIEISTFEELCKIGADPEYPVGYVVYELMNDIDASASKTMNGGKGFEPIGAVLYSGGGGAPTYYGFQGVFNGNGHVIKNLYINRPDEDGVGLFRFLRPYPCDGRPYVETIVRDLGIEADTIIGRNNVGGLAGIAGTEEAAFFEYPCNVFDYEGWRVLVDSCHVRGTVIATGQSVGGLVGESYSFIYKSRSAAKVVSRNQPTDGGGLRQGNCVAGGNALLKTNCAPFYSHAFAGGLVGYNAGIIDNCHATGDVSALVDFVGGLAGTNERSGRIINSYATGEVTAEAGNGVGGLAGRNYNYAHIGRSYATGDVRAAYGYNVGGLAGLNERGVISSSYATGSVSTGGNNAGGLVGASLSAEISNCYAGGGVEGGSTGNIIGGLVGYFDDGSAAESAVVPPKNYSKASAEAPPPPVIGIHNSYATGRFSSNRTGDAFSPTRVGGLVGSYLSVVDMDRIHSSYWDVTVSGINVSAGGGGEGKTTAEMWQRNTFVDWNFTHIWRINEGESYPYFAWQDDQVVSIKHNVRNIRNHANRFMPQITVRGRTLSVKPSSAQSSSSNMLIRMVDMRGKTVYSRAVNNGVNTLSLAKMPAGRYIVEVKNSGVRVGSVPVVVR